MGSKITLADIFTASNDVNGGKYAPAAITHVVSTGAGIGVNSIFNNYSVFRYSKYGPDLTSYDPTQHTSGANETPNDPSQFQTYTNAQNSAASAMQTKGAAPTYGDLVNNPDAATIINYFNAFENVSDDALGPTPYSWTDFLWCKYYGMIPNNRLITLRRYPLPVNDNIKSKGDDILIPMAQAVTWFSEETGNKLSDIIPNKLQIAWKEIEVKEQTVEGNEITIQSLLQVLGKPTASALLPAITTLLQKGQYVKSVDSTKAFVNSLSDNPNSNQVATTPASGTPAYAEFVKYFEKLYSDGAYWDQIYGPVSVINRTQIRDRGLSNTSYSQDIKLNFHYNLRSYGQVRPKIAFLDILSNFLELTYMNGQFLNVLERYVPVAGSAMIDPSVNAMLSEAVSSGNFNKIYPAYKELLAALSKGIGSSVSGYAEDASKAAHGDFSGVANSFGDLAKNYMTLYFGQAMKPIIERSALNYRPVGEWHLVVGNPLNPIATIGDLICKDIEIKLGDELGIDDFPTEVTFTITLQQSKPRDKFTYESLFNLGNGSMYVNNVAAPSSQSNTYDSANPGGGTMNSQNNQGALAKTATNADPTQSQLKNQNDIARTRIGQSYGPKYALGLVDSYFGSGTETTSQTPSNGMTQNKTKTS